ncbi:MAG: hypothetical protein GF332_03610 [Candidatus Moranbacteria bacterium]|nr:hypothetical protein [Candidatus Moranbacteria bacterium]
MKRFALKKILKKKAPRKYFILGVVFVLILVLISTETRKFLYYQDKVLRKTTALNENIEGLSQEQLNQVLQAKAEQMENKIITLKNKQDKIETSLAEMGVMINAERIAEQAYEYGKTGKIFSRLYCFVNSLVIENEIPTYYYIEPIKLNLFIRSELDDPIKAPKTAQVNYEDDFFSVIESKQGFGVDSSVLAAQIYELINNPTKDEIELQEEVVKQPQISTEEAEKAVKKANKIISKNPQLKAGNKEWIMDRDAIADVIEFNQEFDFGYQEPATIKSHKKNDIIAFTYLNTAGILPVDYENGYTLRAEIGRERLEEYLNTVAPGIEQKAVDATLGFDQEEVIIVEPSQPKISLNINGSIEALKKGLLEQKNEIELAIIKHDAEISKETLAGLGIETLIGKGTSNFRGSPRNRKHNIAVGASKFDGLLIGPGEIFSFIENLGPVDASTGYLPELVIKKDKTIPEYGGGMCQVSTTAFRGAVNSGFEIVERRNHAYPVHYYSPQGTDATVYIPSPDLKFVNNTRGHVLIQTKVKGNNLYFEYYGSDDGRRVETIGPVIYDRGGDGSMKAKWTQQVFNADGSLMHEKTFLSKYNSPNKYPHPGQEKKKEDDD